MKFKTGTQSKHIEIKGARVHNLQNIDVTIPRNQLTVVTGVSGSGKSSLVFDTLYAEGQRRYVESLSAYARQFLGKMDKPEVDFIHGISPAIAIEQKVNTRNPRSTVATTTEIYDYLKLLFARIGTTFSPVSGKVVRRDTVESITQHLHTLEPSTQVWLLVPIKPTGKALTKQLEIYLQNGFTRLLLNEQPVNIETFLEQKNTSPGPLFLLIDRFGIEPDDEDNRNRIADSVQTAFFEGHGECLVHIHIQGKIITETYNNRFEADGVTFEEPNLHFFSFNNPFGACRTCEGFGSVIGIDEDLVVPDKNLSVYEDAIVPWRGEKMQEWKRHFIKQSSKRKFPIHKPYAELSEAQKEYLWSGDEAWEGVHGFFKDLEKQTYKIQYRVMLARYRGKTTCPDCKGTRLRKDTNHVRLIDTSFKKINASQYRNLAEILLMTVDEALAYFENLKLSERDQKIAARMLQEIVGRLKFMQHVGLGYLSLNRLSNTLSGGESQRINLATSLGSSLVGSLYILDEPSIGLHPRDTEKLIGVLQNLKNQGTTVVVVEHDEEIMKAADHLCDMGPFAGTHGGKLMAEGNYTELTGNAHSLTGQYLSGQLEIALPAKRRISNDSIVIKGARQHNLKGIDVAFPLHQLTVVTGVSGSGKTTLVKNILYPALLKHLGQYSGEKTGSFERLEGHVSAIKQVEMVDQNPIGKSSRSNPVTYIKAYDPIRELFASLPLSRSRGFKPQHFSFNVDGGRCENCQGEGEITIEMQFMADIHLTCDECQGRRFKEEVLEARYNDRSISDVLHMTIDEAILFFAGEKNIAARLQPLQDVGLGYIQLGQSSNTLSGGEAQRVKLASFLGKGKSQEQVLFIFDEPTTGLHFHDIRKLLDSFNALIHLGHSIVVIEHNLDIIKCADWVIDLGPDAGKNGGELVFAGTPEDLTRIKAGFTARYLKPKIIR